MMPSSMPRLGKEESPANPNEKREGDDDMHHLKEGKYRSSKQSDSDDSSMGEDEDHQQGMVKNDSYENFDDFLREFDRRVAEIHPQFLDQLFSGLTLEEQMSGSVANAKDTEKDNSEKDNESENAKRKKEQLEAEKIKKQKGLFPPATQASPNSIQGKEEC